MKRNSYINISILLCFLLNSFGPIPNSNADDFRLPVPGIMVHLSPPLEPPILKGIKIHPENPFRFDFILDKGDYQTIDHGPSTIDLKNESNKLIKYFLASLTIPEKDLWVNLSPYEKDRIIPKSFGLTEMGRDLLAEDYMLKQITASLIYPEDEIGKKFWKRIYEVAAKRYGTTDIPVNTFNKVWIVPEKAVVYENAKAGTAYIVESKLKVMLEEDYLSLTKHQSQPGDMALAVSPSRLPSETALNVKAPEGKNLSTSALGSQIIREIVIPELTKEVNEDKNFAQLRQVYNSLILATWYKKKIKDSILEQVYADKNKVTGVGINDPKETQQIYQRYLQAFKKGVYNYIKENIDPLTQETVLRKYFSGGFSAAKLFSTDGAMTILNKDTANPAMISSFINSVKNATLAVIFTSLVIFNANAQDINSAPVGTTGQTIEQKGGNSQIDRAMIDRKKELSHVSPQFQEIYRKSVFNEIKERLLTDEAQLSKDQAMNNTKPFGENANLVGDVSEIQGMIKTHIPAELQGLFDAPQRGRFHKEGPTLLYHLQAMKNGLSEIQHEKGAFKAILPLYYQDLIRSNADLYDWFILTHDLGKKNKMVQREDGAISYPDHHQESLRLMDEYHIALDFPQRRELIKLVALHHALFDGNDIKEEIKRDTEGFLKREGVTPKDIDFLLAATFIDMYWPNPANDVFAVDMQRFKKGVAFWEAYKKSQGISNRKERKRYDGYRRDSAMLGISKYDFDKFVHQQLFADIHGLLKVPLSVSNLLGINFIRRHANNDEPILVGKEILGAVYFEQHEFFSPNGPTASIRFYDKNCIFNGQRMTGLIIKKAVESLQLKFGKKIGWVLELDKQRPDEYILSLVPPEQGMRLPKDVPVDSLIDSLSLQQDGRVENYELSGDEHRTIKAMLLAVKGEISQAIDVLQSDDIPEISKIEMKEYVDLRKGHGTDQWSDYLFIGSREYEKAKRALFKHIFDFYPLLLERYTFGGTEGLENELAIYPYFGEVSSLGRQKIDRIISDNAMFVFNLSKDRKSQVSLESEGGKDNLIPKKKLVINIIRPSGYASVSRTMSNEIKRGGIDFTAAKTPLEIQNSGQGIKFHMDPAMFKRLQNAPGFVPVIINIQPLKNLSVFLGIEESVGKS